MLAESKEPGADLQSLTITEGASVKSTLEKFQDEVEAALSDSFDTPRAMRAINELVKETNIHISTSKSNFDVGGVEATARYITKLIGIFGLDANAKAPYEGLGWTSAVASDSSPEETIKPFEDVFQKVRDAVQGLQLESAALSQLLDLDVNAQTTSLISSGLVDSESLILPYVRAVSKIRDEIRRLAPEAKHKKEILALSDQIRDEHLTNLGVYLDDRSDGQAALIKFIPKEELLAAREEKLAKEREKVAQKEAARLAREKLEAEKAEKAKLSPNDMFKDERFSAWDVDGMPTKTKDGEDVPKSAWKKLKKDWDRQKKAHEDWKAKQGA